MLAPSLEVTMASRRSLPQPLAQWLCLWLWVLAACTSSLSSASDTPQLRGHKTPQRRTQQEVWQGVQYAENQSDVPWTTTSSCTFANIEVVLPLSKEDSPLIPFVLASLSLFLPCHGGLHLLVLAHDLPQLSPFLYNPSPGSPFHIHSVAMSAEAKWIDSFEQKLWASFWADSVLSSTAELVLFLEATTFLALPVTCNSLFDNQGRIYAVYWPITSDDQLSYPCHLALNVTSCPYSFMTTMPALVPRRAFAPVRDLFARTAKLESFDAAFQKRARVRYPDIRSYHPVQLLTEYTRLHWPELLHLVHCPSFSQTSADEFYSMMANTSPDTASCLNYVPLAVRTSWRLSAFTDKEGLFSRGHHPQYFRSRFPGQFGAYDREFSQATIVLVQEVMQQGWCLLRFLETKSLPRGCQQDTVLSIHEEVNLYGWDFQPNMEIIYAVFQPDGPGPICRLRFEEAMAQQQDEFAGMEFVFNR